MKRANTFLLAAVVVAVSLLSSCGKYEDGPGFSLLSKKQRLCRTWMVKSVTMGGFTIEDENFDTYYDFKKDGSMTFTQDNVSQTGTWDFANDKEDLTITMNGDAETVEIRRLTNKELWIKGKDGEDDFTFKLEEK